MKGKLYAATVTNQLFAAAIRDVFKTLSNIIFEC